MTRGLRVSRHEAALMTASRRCQSGSICARRGRRYGASWVLKRRQQEYETGRSCATGPKLMDMNARTHHLIDEALALEPDERSAPLIGLRDSLDGDDEPSTRKAWADEIQRRKAELHSGATQGLAWADSLTRSFARCRTKPSPCSRWPTIGGSRTIGKRDVVSRRPPRPRHPQQPQRRQLDQFPRGGSP